MGGRMACACRPRPTDAPLAGYSASRPVPGHLEQSLTVLCSRFRAYSLFQLGKESVGALADAHHRGIHRR